MVDNFYIHSFIHWSLQSFIRITTWLSYTTHVVRATLILFTLFHNDLVCSQKFCQQTAEKKSPYKIFFLFFCWKCLTPGLMLYVFVCQHTTLASGFIWTSMKDHEDPNGTQIKPIIRVFYKGEENYCQSLRVTSKYGANLNTTLEYNIFHYTIHMGKVIAKLSLKMYYRSWDLWNIWNLIEFWATESLICAGVFQYLFSEIVWHQTSITLGCSTVSLKTLASCISFFDFL